MGIRIGNRCCGRNYFIDSITGVIPAQSCPAICGTVTRAVLLPDPPEGCEFYQVRSDDGTNFTDAIYEYHEGTGWHSHATIDGEYVNGYIPLVALGLIDGWTVVLNGVTYGSETTEVVFDNPVYYLTITFISDTGCVYNMDPFGEVPCLWYWEDGDITSGFIVYPQGGAGVNIFSNLDVATLQLTYPYLSVVYTTLQFINPIIIYAPESVVQGWEIDYGLGQVPMTWLPTSPDCPEQEFRCYEFTLDIDLVTYPDAAVYSINGLGIQVPLSSNILTDVVNLRLALNEYLSSVFGGVITTNASYDGTTYTIGVYNVPFYSATPNIQLLSLEVEKAPFDYVNMNQTQITCP